MKSSLIRDIEAWETDGGAALTQLGDSVALMSGTAAQVEWAERIKAQVAAEHAPRPRRLPFGSPHTAVHPPALALFKLAARFEKVLHRVAA